MKKWKRRAQDWANEYHEAIKLGGECCGQAISERNTAQAQVDNLAKQLAGRDARIDELEAELAKRNTGIWSHGDYIGMGWRGVDDETVARTEHKCANCQHWGPECALRINFWAIVHDGCGFGRVQDARDPDTFYCSEWQEREP